MNFFVKCFIFLMYWQMCRPEEMLGGKDKGTLELANVISWVWLYLPLHLPFIVRAYCGYLVIQPSPLDPALINTSYGTCAEVFLMTLFTTSFSPSPLFHSVGQTKTSTSFLHSLSNLWGGNSPRGSNKNKALPAPGLFYTWYYKS